MLSFVADGQRDQAASQIRPGGTAEKSVVAAQTAIGVARPQHRPPVPTFIWSNILVGVLLPFKKKRSNRESGRVRVQRIKHFQVALDNLEIRMALQLGDGDLCLGIRRALVLGSLRQFETLTAQSATSASNKLPPIG